MNEEIIAEALLHWEGYAVFRHTGQGLFRAIGSPPAWFHELSATAPDRVEWVRLGDQFPFLETFLAEAAAAWDSSSDEPATSGIWLERGKDGREIALEAGALLFDGVPILFLRAPQRYYQEQQKWLQTARESVLEHERLVREIQKKEILLHCIIHDLSQPLTALRGCLSCLALESLSATQKELVEIGTQQSEKQEAMIRGILEAFSAELSAQNAFHRDPAKAPDLARCAQRVVADFSPAFAERNARIELETALDSARDWKVVGETSHLLRIYSNLVDNALRFTPAGSGVTLGLADEGRFVRAFVDDQGPGLPEGTPPTELFALLSKGKDRGGKAGLGLYFCRITVERWGGTIGCESRPQGGARFWFRLPRPEGVSTPAQPLSPAGPPDAPSRPAPAPASPVEPVPRTLRVLLAEDDAANRRLATQILATRGHRVTAVADGRQVLVALKAGAYDVVVMDGEMPVMGGVETTTIIRREEQSTGRHLPVLALSGAATPEARERCLRAGTDAWLVKPFAPEDLWRAVERLVPQERSIEATPPAGAPARPSAGIRSHPALLRKLAPIFLKDSAKAMGLIRKALAGQNARQLARVAHRLAGAIGIFGAKDAAVAARRLEELGLQGNLASARLAYRRLERGLALLRRELAPQVARPRRGMRQAAGRKKRKGRGRAGRRKTS